MNPQLRWKFVLILIVIVICLYGLLGLPTFPTSLAQVKANLADRIKLGLDLKGGSHLVLQVQVDEAIGQRCDQAVDQLTKQVHEKNVIVGDIRRVDDTHIEVDNVDTNTSGAFRDLIATQFTDWASTPAAGVVNGYLLTMRPTVVADLRRETMNQALETITRRINALGLTEPTIAFTGRGDNEILVQLPGEGDPSRAKAVIQAGGQLTLNRVADDQTYPSEVAALAAQGWGAASGDGHRARPSGNAERHARADGVLHSGSRADCYRAGLARREPGSRTEIIPDSLKCASSFLLPRPRVLVLSQKRNRSCRRRDAWRLCWIIRCTVRRWLTAA